jgi:hypothetical protein
MFICADEAECVKQQEVTTRNVKGVSKKKKIAIRITECVSGTLM